MARTVDVAIIGGGVIGSAVAWSILADADFDGRVAVIERDPGYRTASSALSASSIRQQFSTPENIRMSAWSFAFLRDIANRLGVPEGNRGPDPVDVALREQGYLYLAPPHAETVMREVHEVQRAEGADVVLLAPTELADRFPWLELDGVALGSLGRSGEGWFDGYALLRAFRDAARRLGAEEIPGEAVAIGTVGRRVTSVTLADGSRVRCGAVVDAAGPWAARVARMAGVDLPVEARRRTVYAFGAAPLPPDCPLVVDTSGLWFRPEGEGFIAATAPAEADDRRDLPLVADRGDWEATLWPRLASRVPAFDAARLRTAWAGYYEFNTWDRNAILGPHPDLPNLLFANGFTGHGIQQAPAVGRAIAELIVHGRYVTLDLSVFGFERIAAGRRVVERNVIG